MSILSISLCLIFGIPLLLFVVFVVYLFVIQAPGLAGILDWLFSLVFKEKPDYPLSQNQKNKNKIKDPRIKHY